MTQLLTMKILYFSLGIREILVPTLIVGGMALLLGLLLGIVSKLFQIPVDPLEAELKELLPGANCGACGFSGCEGYAVYLANGGKDTGKCPVGGSEVSNNIAVLLGIPAKPVLPVVAHVMCHGDCHHTTKRFQYQGTIGCNAAQGVFSGPGSCTFGCMGFGDCVEKCPYDALSIQDGIAVVDEQKCRACGLCVTICPKKIIFIVPKYQNGFKVECRNKWPGGETRKHCSVGCIGCRRCYNICPSDAISMDGPLAVIDPDKCTQCGKCYEVCPTHSISCPPGYVPIPEQAGKG